MYVQTGRVKVRQFLKNIGWRTMELLTLQRDFVLAVGLETGTVQVRYAVIVRASMYHGLETYLLMELTKNALILMVPAQTGKNRETCIPV